MEEIVQSPVWGLMSLIFFFVFFAGVVAWVFRPGSKNFYKNCGEIPVKEDKNGGQ